jgi:ATP-dependent RNA helicase HelY
MFDAGTATLIRTAPPVEGIDPETLPQDLTKAYAELVALRLRVGEPDADGARELKLDRLLRIASFYEAVADTGRVAAERQAAAFVAATAYQIVGRIGATEGVRPADLLCAAAIHPLVAAPLLFLIAGQSPDAREAGRRLQGLSTDDLLLTALLETIADLSAERFEAILQRAGRLTGLRSSPEVSLETQGTQALYGLCWSGLTQMIAEVMDQPVPRTAFRQFESPQAAFVQVEHLSLADVLMPDEGGRLVVAFTGPRHLARLLRQVAGGLVGAGLATLPAPTGVNEEIWRSWVRYRAKSKPVIWPNHRPVIDAGLLDLGRSVVLVLPTGAGKTTVSELKIAATLAAGRKVIFLVPTLALVDQLRDDLSSSFPKDLSGTVVSADGDLTVLADGPELSQIEVMTPERLLALLSFADADVSEVGLIVIDECHILSRVGGGSRSLDAMLCLLHAAKRAPQSDFLLLSAMLTNGQEIADWLTELTGRQASFFYDPWKPSRQARGVVVYPQSALTPITVYARAKGRGRQPPKQPPLTATAHALFGLQNNWSPASPSDTGLVRLMAEPVMLAIGTYGPTPNANNVAATIASRSAAADLKTIIFVQQADHACTTARKIAAGLDRIEQLTQSELNLQAEIAVELGSMGQSLVDSSAGALPHNGDMLSTERRLAESLYQRPDGAKVIVATPTLAQGMNLPAQVAILAGNKRHDDIGRAELQQHELLNAAGRAGRAGHLANGTVLLIPEPVVGFDARGRASSDAISKLRSILPASDQCVRIEDPLAWLLDQIQIGALESAEVRYVLSRLRAGEPAELASSAAITMVQKSLAAFQARARDEDQSFAAKTVALQAALAAEVETIDPDVTRIAAFTGLSTTAMQVAAARLERDLDVIPTTIVGWSEWLIDFLAEDAEARVALLEKDADLINAVTRGKKAGGTTKPAEFDRLKAGLRSWIEGKPFDEIEVALGVNPLRVGTCNRARDLVLKLANRRFYMIAAAIAELAKVKLVAASREAANPAVLEILAVALRRGFDTPEKAAFAHLNPSIRTRVGLHRAFGERLGVVEPMLGRPFRDVLSNIETQLLFANLDLDEI